MKFIIAVIQDGQKIYDPLTKFTISQQMIRINKFCGLSI